MPKLTKHLWFLSRLFKHLLESPDPNPKYGDRDYYLITRVGLKASITRLRDEYQRYLGVAKDPTFRDKIRWLFTKEKWRLSQRAANPPDKES